MNPDSESFTAVTSVGSLVGACQCCGSYSIEAETAQKDGVDCFTRVWCETCGTSARAVTFIGAVNAFRNKGEALRKKSNFVVRSAPGPCPRCGGATLALTGAKYSNGEGWQFKVECKACYLSGEGATQQEAIDKLKGANLEPNAFVCPVCASRKLVFVRVLRDVNDRTLARKPFSRRESPVQVKCEDCGKRGLGSSPAEALQNIVDLEVEKLRNKTQAKSKLDYEKFSKIPYGVLSAPLPKNDVYVGVYPAPPPKGTETNEKVKKSKIAKPKISEQALLPVVPFVLDPEPENTEDDDSEFDDEMES